jgi:hypothetical protein
MSTSAETPDGAQWNAFKHGLYGNSILLPGDNVAEFLRERRALFHNYRPRTKDEADMVEAMAEHLWVCRRYRPAQARFDGQALTPAADAAGQICEPVGHQRLHSGMDVTVQRKRIENMWHRARAQLVLMQKLRRQGLVEGAVTLPQDCYMETDGRVFGPVMRPVIVPIPEPDIETDKLVASGLGDGGIGKNLEQKEMGGEVGQPATSPALPAGAVLLGASSKPPAPARPTGPEQGQAVLPSASRNSPVLTRPTGPEQGSVALPAAGPQPWRDGSPSPSQVAGAARPIAPPAGRV